MLEPSPTVAAAALRAYERPKVTRLATADSDGISADKSRSGGTASSSDPLRAGCRGAPPRPVPAGELLFDGAHILEAYDLSPATTTGRLEAWLESLQLHPLGPVVRHARPLRWRYSVDFTLELYGVASRLVLSNASAPWFQRPTRGAHHGVRPRKCACSMQAVPVDRFPWAA